MKIKVTGRNRVVYKITPFNWNNKPLKSYITWAQNENYLKDILDLHYETSDHISHFEYCEATPEYIYENWPLAALGDLRIYKQEFVDRLLELILNNKN